MAVDGCAGLRRLPAPARLGDGGWCRMEGGAGWRVVQDLQDPQDRPKKLILWKMQDSLVAIPHQPGEWARARLVWVR